MKRNGFILIAVILAWLAAVNWAVNWADGLDYSDFPNEQKLAAARFLWQYSPALDVETDAERAVKFSWITVSTKINDIGTKDTQILGPLGAEIKFLGDYLRRHLKVSQSIKNRFLAHVILYLNRADLFQKYTDPKVEKRILEVDFAFEAEPDPMIKEIWYREMMIRAHLKNNIPAYQSYKAKLTTLYKNETTIFSPTFIQGVMSFYEGVLLCIGTQPEKAIMPLNDAIEKMAPFPENIVGFFLGDLNVLLYGRGKQSMVCNDLLDKLVLSGA